MKAIATYWDNYLLLFNPKGVSKFTKKVTISPHDNRFAYTKVDSENTAVELSQSNGYRFVPPHVFAKHIIEVTGLSKLGRVPEDKLVKRYFRSLRTVVEK